MIRMPEIDNSKCDLCGWCIDACGCNAIVRTPKGLVIVETEECHWCALCEAVCPTGALTCAFDIVVEQS